MQDFNNFIPYGYTQKTLEEKKEIKKTGNIIGICTLFLFGISFFWVTALYAVLSKLGVDTLKVQEVISDPAVMQVIQIFISILMFTLPFIIVSRVYNYRISDLVPLSKPKKKLFLPFFFIGVGFCAFANIASSVCGSFFASFGIEYNVDFGENPQGFFGFLLSFLATAIVPALVEEFACRGIILNLLKKFGDGFAIIASSIVFGLLHGNFIQIPFAFLVGLVLAYITVKTKTIWIAVGVHFFNNLISVVFDYAFNNVSIQIQNVGYTIFLALCLLLTIVGAVMLRGIKEKDENGADFYKLESGDTECTEKQKYKWFFCSPIIIIFCVVCIFEALMFFFI